MIRISFAFEQMALILDADVSSNILKPLYHLLREALSAVGSHKIAVQLNRKNAVSALSVMSYHAFD